MARGVWPPGNPLEPPLVCLRESLCVLHRLTEAYKQRDRQTDGRTDRTLTSSLSLSHNGWALKHDFVNMIMTTMMTLIISQVSGAWQDDNENWNDNDNHVINTFIDTISLVRLFSLDNCTRIDQLLIAVASLRCCWDCWVRSNSNVKACGPLVL